MRSRRPPLRQLNSGNRFRLMAGLPLLPDLIVHNANPFTLWQVNALCGIPATATDWHIHHFLSCMFRHYLTLGQIRRVLPAPTSSLL